MAITVLYEWPVATPGSTTPPTGTTPPPTIPTSTVRYNTVVAELVGDSSSTSVVITHNLALTTSQLAVLQPEVAYEPLVSGAPTIWVSARATNTVTIGFSATSAVTFGLVRIRRPFGPTR